jgi:hypothetical protein
MKKIIFIILIAISIPFITKGQNFSEDFYTGKIMKKMKKISKLKINIWIETNKERYDFLNKTKLGKLKYCPAECADETPYISEISNGYEKINEVCPLYTTRVYCYNSKNIIYKEIFFSFTVYGEFDEITIYDCADNAWLTIYQQW